MKILITGMAAYQPKVHYKEGISIFLEWDQSYYKA